MNERSSIYKSKIAEHQAEFDSLSQRSRRIAYYRLVVLLIGLVAIFTIGEYSVTVLALLILATVIGFLILVKRHLELERLRQRAMTKKEICENELTVLHQFENVYYNGTELETKHHYYANDLDVFGHSSLYGIINRCRTYHGTRLLGDWFSAKHDIETINQRTEAVKELESDAEWRLQFLSDLFELNDIHHEDYAQKVRTELDGSVEFLNSSLLNIYTLLLPIFWIGLAILTWINWELGSSLATMFFLVNLGIVMRYYKPISSIQNRLSKSDTLLEKFIQALERIDSRSWASPLNVSRSKLQNLEDNSATSPIRMLSELKKIIIQLDARLNMIAAVILNGFLLWDIRIVKKLQVWKTKYLHQINHVFEQIGYFEAITSLSTWAFNHTGYNYANLDNQHFHLSIQGARHPLIKTEECVANDFELSKTGNINIITGSNMAGKSTFLRTIGTNMLLAYTGTKVAASSMNTSVVQVMCYMRIKDSLEENTSTFKAELNRIELMLSLMDEGRDSFFLIDEMLRGTNSKDKLRGSINITKKLIQHQACAMIATHDIKLAELESEYPDTIVNYYFDIDYKDGELQFDYKLKSGICENFNASYLLEKIGIS